MEWNGRKIYIHHTHELTGTEVRGAAAMDDVGYYVLINANNAPLIQRRALGHELAHIYKNHHFQPERPIDEIEREADRFAWEYYRAYRDGKLPG